MHTIEGDLALLALLDPQTPAHILQCAILPAPAAAIQAADLFGRGIVEETEHVAADARGARFGHVEPGGHGHGRVGAVAAFAEDLEAALCGERLRAGYDGFGAVDGGAAGGEGGEGGLGGGEGGGWVERHRGW